MALKRPAKQQKEEEGKAKKKKENVASLLVLEPSPEGGEFPF